MQIRSMAAVRGGARHGDRRWWEQNRHRPYAPPQRVCTVLRIAAFCVFLYAMIGQFYDRFYGGTTDDDGASSSHAYHGSDDRAAPASRVARVGPWLRPGGPGDAQPGPRLACERSQDYGSIVMGHHWDSWMAKPHSYAESYDVSRGTPRVPCDGYWQTGVGESACAALPFSEAARNATLRRHCGVLLDNSYERGRAIPPSRSRREGWPHLPADSLANAGMRLPGGGGGEGGVSSIPWSYPLSATGKPVEVTTLELMRLVHEGLQGASSTQWARNAAAN